MKKKILCPYCAKSFAANKALYQCTNKETKYEDVKTEDGVERQLVERCPSVVDECLDNYWKEAGVLTKRVFRARVFRVFSDQIKGAKCPICQQPTSRLVCPECHNPLPPQMVEKGSVTISIVGDRSSGKTVYFLSLMHQLKKYGYKLGLYEVNPLDLAHNEQTKTSAVYTRMSSQMFDDLRLPNQTRALRPAPMIFRLSFKGQKSKDSKSIFLVFYDTAGEIFQDSEKINEVASYLKESAGVIFLIDPFSMEGLHSTLKEGGIVSEDANDFVKADPSKVFGSLMQINGGERLKGKPLALAYSKIDAVIEAIRNNGQGYSIPGVNLLNNSSFIRTGKFSLKDVETIHDGLKHISEEEWDAGRFWGSASGAYEESNVRMFAFSALGNNPDEMGNIKKPAPYRVMDPLIWILYKMGFAIPTEE